MLRFLGQLIVLAMLWPASALAQQQEFLPPELAFKLTATPQGNGHIQLHWDISEGYYLYRKQLVLHSEPAGRIQKLTLPDGIWKKDEFFGDSEVYYNTLEAHVNASDAQALTVQYQGCAEAGICYPPQSRRISLKSTPEDSDQTRVASPSFGASISSPAPISQDQKLAERLSTAHLGWMLLIFFGLGLLLTFTPCVLPMVPILSSLVVGHGASPRQGAALSCAFVLPMALTYALLGVAAAFAGAHLQAALQTPWLLGGLAVFFILLALAMFGLYELQLPACIRNRLHRASSKQATGTLVGAAVMGILSALLVGPCMTAPLAGALLYISNTGNAVSGGLALFAMGLGMGLPLILVGTLGTYLLPRPGVWMERIKSAFGFILIAVAITFIARVIPAPLTVGLWGAWLLAVALSLLMLACKLDPAWRRWLSLYAALLLGLWGAIMVIGAALGARDPLQPLAIQTAAPGPASIAATRISRSTWVEQHFTTVNTQHELDAQLAEARRQGQWTLVDFYADWCVACKVIERDVLSDTRVQKALSGMRLVRPDVSAHHAEQQALMTAYQVFGPPTLLFIGPDGVERRAQRIIGELSADAFLDRLNQARPVH